jgi:L-2-hydroxyglutarate oxidase LhgO
MCGKVIISSTSSEHAKLQRLHRNAELVGIDDLLLLSGQDVRKLEPQVQCFSGLLSPGTGIFDSHTYMTHLVGRYSAAMHACILRVHGVTIVFNRGHRGEWVVDSV